MQLKIAAIIRTMDKDQPLTFRNYSEIANSTEVHSSSPLLDDIYPLLKLPGEVGEICEKIGKVMRDQGGVYTDEDKEAISKEVGDVLWYLNRISRIFGTTLEDIALENLRKIQKRRETGTTRGSGDNRENETTD